MMGAQGDVIVALIAAMGADAAAGEMLGDPVRVWDQVPQGAVFPYVQIGGCESRPLRGDAGAVEHLVVLNCVSRFAGAEEARAVAGVVEGALARLELSGLVSCEVRGVEVRRTSDQARAFAVMRLRVVVDLG
jgi:hypothetical protein